MNRIRLLVVEDDWMCCEALRSIIEKSETIEIEIVGSAADAETALSQVLSLKPDVVLMDIRLSGQMSGIEAAARMNRAGPDAKVLILTNCQDEESLYAAIDAGAAGYLLKGEINGPMDILRAIQEVHCGKGYITPTISGQIITTLKNYRMHQDYTLTKREKEVLRHISQGKNNRLIAEQLNIRERTVANHVSNILFKINARNRTEAVALVRQAGIII